jgi:hypothetical protein
VHQQGQEVITVLMTEGLVAVVLHIHRSEGSANLMAKLSEAGFMRGGIIFDKDHVE